MIIIKNRDADRIIKIIEDQDGNLVVAINKYGWLSCIFHSLYGIVIILCLLATIPLFIYFGFWTLLLCICCLFFWLKAWLNANDNLKGRLYPDLLEKHLLEKDKIKNPFIIKRFYPYMEFVKCINHEGMEVKYKVEFMQEQLPLYVVKIHTMAEKK